jgi:hypothetical protein
MLEFCRHHPPYPALCASVMALLCLFPDGTNFPFSLSNL